MYALGIEPSLDSRPLHLECNPSTGWVRVQVGVVFSYVSYIHARSRTESGLSSSAS